MAMSEAEKLPEEITVDILGWLPAKSVGQFRCVSKHWNSLLSDPKFIKAHLTNSHKHHEQKKLIIVSRSLSLHTLTFTLNPQNGIDVLSRMLNFPQFSDKWWFIHGSCNGLILVGSEGKVVNYLINPLTLECHKIPNFDTAHPGHHGISAYGLGYDVVRDDYKVVALSHAHGLTVDAFVDVYSVIKGIWRRLENSPYDHSAQRLASGVLVNGALHWLATKPPDNSLSIIAFDLSDEKFLEVPPSPTLNDRRFGTKKLVTFRGCLCVLSSYCLDLVEIVFWIMNDYGVKESWTKLIVKGQDYYDYFEPICLMGENVVMLDQDGSMMLYNMRDDKLRHIDGCPVCVGNGFFRESLVSPMHIL